MAARRPRDVHGLIHLFRVVEGFGFADVEQLTQPVAPGVAVLWLIAAVAVLASAPFTLLRSRGWWWLTAAAALVSQTAILSSWGDAKAGTAANVSWFWPRGTAPERTAGGRNDRRRGRLGPTDSPASRRVVICRHGGIGAVWAGAINQDCERPLRGRRTGPRVKGCHRTDQHHVATSGTPL